MFLIVYILGIIIYCILPLGLQIPLLLLNTVIPDSIPCLDEIIMYSSTLKKIVNACKIIDWIKEHKLITGIILIVLILVVIIVV